VTPRMLAKSGMLYEPHGEALVLEAEGGGHHEKNRAWVNVPLRGQEGRKTGWGEGVRRTVKERRGRPIVKGGEEE